MAEEKQLVMVADSSGKRLNEEESSNKKCKTSAAQQLPHEIMVEILSRLPVETLIRFRCVSKSFKTLISDAHFIKTHLTNSRNLCRSRFIVLSRGGSALSVLKSCPLHSIFGSDALQLHSYSFSSHSHYWLVGSCDGLICLALKQESVTLVNPSTRVLHELPYLGFPKKFGSYTVFGFGYDSLNDDYKVVAVFCYQTNRNTPNRGIGYQTIVEVSSLASRRWTRIGSFAYGVPYDVSGKYVDGTLNWPVMYQGDSGLMWDVVSFDLAKETYKEVMQPDYGELGYDRTLGVFDGWLCVMCNYRGVRADLWVMKQYGVRESWVKLVSIPYLDHPGSFWYSVPYAIAHNGEVLMEFNSLVIYNPKDGTFRYPMMGNTDTWGEPETYIETLVSPKVED